MARILVVDDEESILTYLRMLLEDHGHRVRTANGAAEALESLRENTLDLMTLDIMMPKRSGISLYCELRRDEEFADLPVIFVSGFTPLFRVGSESSFRGLVPDRTIPPPEGFLEKPVEVDHLLGLIERLTASEAGAEPTRSAG